MPIASTLCTYLLKYIYSKFVALMRQNAISQPSAKKRGIEGPFFTVGFAAAASTLVLHYIATLPPLQVEKQQ